MILPHCTWDKFGDILANNGGRVYGLFDELVSFFSTMNMYSSSKSDNREYQDFLKMFTGKAKHRETSKYSECCVNLLYKLNKKHLTPFERKLPSEITITCGKFSRLKFLSVTEHFKESVKNC